MLVHAQCTLPSWPPLMQTFSFLCIQLILLRVGLLQKGLCICACQALPAAWQGIKLASVPACGSRHCQLFDSSPITHPFCQAYREGVEGD